MSTYRDIQHCDYLGHNILAVYGGCGAVAHVSELMWKLLAMFLVKRKQN